MCLGWQLGEHQEWAKYSNFETAVRTPLLVHIPSSVSSMFTPSRCDALVELVDLMPTLSDVCGLAVPQNCPIVSNDTILCTEGHSFVPLLHNASIPWKSAVFSQYPRPSDKPCEYSDSPVLANITIMGYSIRTDQYRYTEWIGFNHTNLAVDWDDIRARELYSHELNDNEDNNLADNPEYEYVVSHLSTQLREGWRKALPDEY
jgi:iduronate 2-sulfatase